MKSKITVGPVAAAISATLLGALPGVSAIASEQNPFGMTDLSSGYTVAFGDRKQAEDEGSNAGITAKIKSKLLADTEAPGLKINVTTNEGVVTLEGNVKSDAEKQRAEEIATSTEGVIRVNNLLTVGVGADVKAGEGKCGEGKAKEGSCGEGKAHEGSCGEGKK